MHSIPHPLMVSSLSYTIHAIRQEHGDGLKPRRTVFSGMLKYEEETLGGKVVTCEGYHSLYIELNTYSVNQGRQDLRSLAPEGEVIGAYVDKGENVCHMRAYGWKNGIEQRLMVAGMRYKSAFPEEVRQSPFDDDSVVNFLCDKLYCITHYYSHFLFPIRLEYGKEIIHIRELTRELRATLGIDLCPPRSSTKRKLQQIVSKDESEMRHSYSIVKKEAEKDEPCKEEVEAADALMQFPYLYGAWSSPLLCEE